LTKNKGKALSRGEIAEILKEKIGITAVSHSLKNLVDWKEVKVIEIGREEAKKKYNCKRRIRLYYL